jgi:TatD DNase family protein
MWTDSHAHLDDPKFDADRDETIRRALQAGVDRIITVGTDLAGSREAVRIASKHSRNIWPVVGFHPHEADRVDLSMVVRWLDELAREPRVVALGETGLDFHKQYAAPDNQRRLFETHLEAARQRALPAVIHCRNAHAEVLEILRRDPPPRRGVIHCFSGNAEEAQAYLELGFVLSISGTITYPNAGALREVVRRLPPERLLVETDCPYLAPQNHRGARNEPAYVAHTGACVAELLGMTAEAFAERATQTARELFELP